MYPGCKCSRDYAREARYYAKTRAFASYYATSSRGARGYVRDRSIVRRRNFARSHVKIISARSVQRRYIGAHGRCVEAARVRACSRLVPSRYILGVMLSLFIIIYM